MAEHKMDPPNSFDMKVDLGGGRQATVPVDSPGNSYMRRASAQERPKPKEKEEKIVTGKVTRKKKGLGWKFKEALFGERGVEGMVETVVTDILVSAFKNMMSDMVHRGAGSFMDGMDRMLFGENRYRRTTDRPGGYFSYNKVPSSTASPYRVVSNRARTRHEFDDVIFESRADAEDILDRLRIILEDYKVVSVADYLQCLGEGSEFTDTEWGWLDLRQATVRRVRGGYSVVLPRTQPIN